SARNFGIRKAKGEFIAFLDDDDLFKFDKIEKQLDILMNYPKYDLVHSSATVIEHDGKITNITIGASNDKSHLRTGNVFWNALGRWCVKSPTPLLRKEIFEKVMFDETIEVSEDFDFYQRLFYFFQVYYINESLAYYRDSNKISRLSKKAEKYVGVERQFFNNYLKMGVKNPFTLYRIALRLAHCGIKNWNLYYTNNKIVVNKWKLILNPFYYIKNLNKLSEKVEYTKKLKMN
ncbi:MAG: glycosyltransferase, partial [Flavobacterium sp.]